MIWCLNCGKSYGSRPQREHVCNPRDVALQGLFAAHAAPTDTEETQR